MVTTRCRARVLSSLSPTPLPHSGGMGALHCNIMSALSACVIACPPPPFPLCCSLLQPGTANFLQHLCSVASCPKTASCPKSYWSISVASCCIRKTRLAGGNVDDRRIGIGASMYYPVAVEGGLVSMGDAHSAQGDSEFDGKVPTLC